jgi:2-polyprenyl-6-hydroxyphenyl methylase/3-demethylubiquinone-9 3-methyltransferase
MCGTASAKEVAEAMSVIAPAYGWQSSGKTYSHEKLLPLVAKLGHDLGTKSFLDVGVGNGSALSFWLQQGWRVAAMEPDAEGFGFASRVAGADVRQLGVDDAMPADWSAAFDTIASLEVVEHLFNPESLVRVCAQGLRPGGHAMISTPYHGYLKNVALSLAGKWDYHHHPLRVGGHIKFWSNATLTELFERGPFAKVAFHGVGRLPLLWKSMLLVFRKTG